jgi:hypothetical protein
MNTTNELELQNNKMKSILTTLINNGVLDYANPKIKKEVEDLLNTSTSIQE